MGDNGVGQSGRIIDHRHARQHLGRDAFVEFDIGFEGGFDRTHEGFEFHRHFLVFFNLFNLCNKNRFRSDVSVHTRPFIALHQDLDRAIRKPEQLYDTAQTTYTVNILRLGIVGFGIDLGDEQYVLFLVHGLIEGIDGLFPPHKEGDHHVRKNDDVPERKGRYLLDF
ncbi:MAG: hypothetical protein ACD_62C00003G0017 [uncultured bacterium]|nr:MAG: hypothetical protein ACD_62C00003G0017 [uncultured bacterium]